MAKKTNKTSHILDLLTNGPAPETPTPKKVTVVDEGSRNDKLSQEILNNLSEELELEAQPETETDTGIEEQPDAAVSSGSPSPIQMPEDAAHSQDITKTETEPMEELEIELENLAVDDKDDEYHFINVMEELLKQQDLEAAMKRLNMCTCPRCNADVRALTLTALPAKYVVIGQNSFSPVLNFYQNKFQISMMTALNKACSIVRDRPHHKR